jgi:hypothetical protein
MKYWNGRLKKRDCPIAECTGTNQGENMRNISSLLGLHEDSNQ